MAEKAGLEGRKVNHSARKTTVTSLLHSDVQPTTIMQLTGHRNLQSVNDYSAASLKQQKEMSFILSDISSGTKNIVSTAESISTAESYEFDNAGDSELASVDFENIAREIEIYENSDNSNKQVMNISNHSNKENSLPECTSLPCLPKYSLMPNANISNVTINIYPDKN